MKKILKFLSLSLVIVILLLLTVKVFNVEKTEKKDFNFSTTADCLNFFILDEKVYVHSGVVPSWFAHLSIDKYLGKTQYLSEKDYDYVPENPGEYENLQGNIEGLDVYTFFLKKTDRDIVICHNADCDMYYIYKIKS